VSQELTITSRELDIFTIPSFEERMQEIKKRITPALTILGEQLVDELTPQTGQNLYPHVAKHARRTVNPPDETWVALSPSKKGYKMYVHLAVGVGYYGSFVKCIAKAQSPEKKLLVEAVSKLESLKHIWIIKGENPVETDRENILEVLTRTSYGLEIGTVLDGVPGESKNEWLKWSLDEIAAVWPLYQYVRKRV